MAKVLLFTPRYPPQSGGSAIYFSNIVADLSDEHEFSILTYRDADGTHELEQNDVTVYRLIPRPKNLPGVFRGFIESFISFLISLYILKDDVDIAHVHAAAYASPGVTAATLVFSTPIIYDCRDELFPPWLVKIGDVRFWFSCAPNIDTRLVENGVPGEKIIRAPVVNPDYVDEIKKKYTGRSNGSKFQIVFAGRLIEEKGVFELVNAFEIFKSQHSHAELVLIGDDPKGDVKSFTYESRVKEDITLTGEVPHEEAIKLINEADVLVLPSKDEGLPRVVIEAFQLGVPVVATPVGYIPELIEDEETGILVDGTPSAISYALTELYQDDSLRKRLAINAEQVAESWSWDTVVEKIHSGYIKATS
jgi:glycosyltransferase involved in cell wall biosynthesis